MIFPYLIALLKLIELSFVLSHGWLFVTSWTVAYQASLSMEFSRQEVLEWVAISFFRGSFRPRDQTWVSHIAGRHFTIWAIREAHWLCLGLIKRGIFKYKEEDYKMHLSQSSVGKECWKKWNNVEKNNGSSNLVVVGKGATPETPLIH